MKKHTVSASACLPSNPERVYATIADYRDGHPRILPPQFTDLTVEKGGFGEGTVIRFQMRLMGTTQIARAAITEPQPGRLLVETDLGASGFVTSFAVDPAASPGHAQVTISTEFPVRGGILGAIQRRLIGSALLPIYRRELELLAAVTAQ